MSKFMGDRKSLTSPAGCSIDPDNPPRTLAQRKARLMPREVITYYDCTLTFSDLLDRNRRLLDCEYSEQIVSEAIGFMASHLRSPYGW